MIADVLHDTDHDTGNKLKRSSIRRHVLRINDFSDGRFPWPRRFREQFIDDHDVRTSGVILGSEVASFLQAYSHRRQITTRDCATVCRVAQDATAVSHAVFTVPIADGRIEWEMRYRTRGTNSGQAGKTGFPFVQRAGG